MFILHVVNIQFSILKGIVFMTFNFFYSKLTKDKPLKHILKQFMINASDI